MSGKSTSLPSSVHDLALRRRNAKGWQSRRRRQTPTVVLPLTIHDILQGGQTRLGSPLSEPCAIFGESRLPEPQGVRCRHQTAVCTRIVPNGGRSRNRRLETGQEGLGDTMRSDPSQGPGVEGCRVIVSSQPQIETEDQGCHFPHVISCPCHRMTTAVPYSRAAKRAWATFCASRSALSAAASPVTTCVAASR